MKTKKIVIVGGGLSGLATAYYLLKLSQKHDISLDLKVLEASDEWGGALKTVRHEDFLLEMGAESFITEKPWALDLCHELGLQDQIIETQEEFRRSFVVHQQKLYPVPQGLYLIAPRSLNLLKEMPFLSIKGKLRMAMEPWIPSRKPSGDESVASFVRRRLGSEVLQKLGQPMIGGIYTADPEKLSLQATLAKFLTMEQEHGSVIRALQNQTQKGESVSGPRYSLFVTLREGLGTLIERLGQSLPENSLKKNAKVVRVTQKNGWNIHFEDGEPLRADAVILSSPGFANAQYLSQVDAGLSDLFAGIEYASIATVNIALKKTSLTHPLDGFGFVMPATESKGVVGCTFSSTKFEGRSPSLDKVLLRAFVGGALKQEALDLDDESLKRSVLTELTPLLGIREMPLWMRLCRYPKAMPQYHLGHLQRMASIQEKVEGHDGLYLTGNLYRGVGLPDCIYHAKQTAEKCFEKEMKIND